jgi:hypothetical protein
MLINFLEERMIAEMSREKTENDLLHSVITALPNRIRESSEKGERFLRVIEVSDRGFRGFLTDFLDIKYGGNLVGVYRKIFEYCKKVGLKPRIVEGGAHASFYYIYIYW